MYRLFTKYLLILGGLMAVHGSMYATQSDSLDHFVVIEGLTFEHQLRVQRLDSSQTVLLCNDLLNTLRKEGYWLASVDQIRNNGDTLWVRFYQGRQFSKIVVDLREDHFSVADWKHFPYRGTRGIRSPADLQLEIEKILDYFERNGFPFASVTMDSTQLKNEILYATMQVDPGIRITYDSLQVQPPGVINPVFLSKYLGLNYDKNYNELDLKTVDQRMQQLPFVSLDKVSTTFQLKKAKVSLHLTPKKINYLDGILGLVPDRNGEGVELTGELNLSINNLFLTGKKIEVRWNKLQPGSQQLHASYLHPIILGSPLDLYFSIDQLRQDTTYSNRSLKLAFDYRPGPKLRTRLSYENLLGNELHDGLGTSGDFNVDYYGLVLTWSQLDLWINPKNGLKMQWESNIGRKQIRNDPNIPESTQYRLRLDIEYYKRWSKHWVLYLASQSGMILNEYLYLNDLFRLGGIKTIRGFNELDFFASKYTLFNLEWRYFLDDNSYLVAFYDQSFLSYDILSGTFTDRPAGLGVGMQFMTNTGNFKILYGLGSRQGESYSWANSKIHFGYTAIF